MTFPSFEFDLEMPIQNGKIQFPDWVTYINNSSNEGMKGDTYAAGGALGGIGENTGETSAAAKSMLDHYPSHYHDNGLDYTMASHNHNVIAAQPMVYDLHWSFQGLHGHNFSPFPASQPFPVDNNTDQDAGNVIRPLLDLHLVFEDRVRGEHTSTVIGIYTLVRSMERFS